MKKTFLIIVLSLSLLSCKSYKPPQKYDFSNTADYEMSYDAVWNKVIQYFADLGIPIKTIDKASGLIATDMNLDASGFKEIMDCGTPGSGLLSYRIENPIGNFNVVVTKLSEKTTRVKVTTFYKAVYAAYDYQNYNWYKISQQTINCNSTGLLETTLLNFIAK